MQSKVFLKSLSVIIVKDNGNGSVDQNDNIEKFQEEKINFTIESRHPRNLLSH